MLTACHIGSLREIGEWIYHFQTLISALIALMAAGFTVLILHKQINVSKNQHQDTIDRKHRASKAGMPMALVSISKYSNECFFYIANMRQAIGKQSDQAARVIMGDDKIPSFPTNAFEQIRKVVEYSDLKQADELAKFIGDAQV